MDTATERVVLLQPRSCSTGTSKAPGTERTPAATSVASTATATTTQP